MAYPAPFEAPPRMDRARLSIELGAWHDVGWWQLELRERRGEPGAVRPPEPLRGSAEWAQALRAGERLFAGKVPRARAG